MVEVKQHYQEIKKVLWFVLLLNWTVAVAKILFGYLSRSSSMTADGFHSLSDGTSNIIGLVGIGFASQPKDDDHPYGHKKYETLCALAIAVMLFIVAFNLAKEGIMRFIKPVSPQVSIISFVVMAVTLIVNFIVMFYEYRRGKQLGSDILVVDSLHTRADIFTSLSVIVALIAVKLGFTIIDPIITIVIGGFIAYSGFEIVRQEAGILCDSVAIEDTEKLRLFVMRIKGVKNCHKIRTRGRPDDVNLDLHVQVLGDISLRQSHELSHIVQTEIMKAFPQITDVLVHLEPD